MTNASRWISYNFAVLRAVPHVHTGVFIPVGIVLHARTAEFIGVRVISEIEELKAKVGGADAELLLRYLESCKAIAEGEMTAGPIALAPPLGAISLVDSPQIGCDSMWAGARGSV
jgi:hypothetical protein